MKKVEIQLVKFSSVIMEMDAVYEEYCNEIGISRTALQVMELVSDNEDCTQKMIRERTFMPKQTVHSAVRVLLKKGWVEEKPNEDDKRSKILCLTARGRKVSADHLARLKEAETVAFKKMSFKEREVLIEHLEKYTTKLRKELNDFDA